MDYFKRLNDKQIEAVKHTEGALLIIAGAGSGKTTTMTRRIAYMIGEKGVAPYNILAVTFTNKAANEMKERIEAIADDTRGMWVLTFHAACLRILRKYIDRLGYGTDFTIYDTSDQKTVIKECMAELDISEREYPVPYIQSIISSNKNQGISPEQYQKDCDDFKSRIGADMYLRYSEKLKKNNALDFDDLLVKTVELFKENADVLDEYADRFKYIMIDEYQDTNGIQYEMIHMLAGKHGNICAVGDEDQCIYQWRGATIRNILEFEHDFKDARIIKLEQNYRSDANILGGANSVIKNNFERKGKTLWTDRGEGEKIRIYRAFTDKEEAFYIGREILKLMDKMQIRKSDVAVLYRTHAQSRVFEEAFSKQDIAYRVIGGLRFYDRKEVKDVISYMRLIHNNKDNLAFKRVINEPKRGMGDKTVEKIWTLSQVSGTGMFETLSKGSGMELVSAKSAESVLKMVEMVEKFTALKDEMKISEIYDGILKESGYLDALEAQNTIEAKSRIENLMEFKSVIYDFEAQEEPGTYEEFLEKIALLTDVDNLNADEDAVSLMTLHSAKGLEFPVVFMPGMEKGTFPGRRAYESIESMEEERRLCYVGMTRAEKLLYMSAAESRTVYGRTETREESQFLDEIDETYVERYESENRGSLVRDKYSGEKFSSRDQLKYRRQQNTAVITNTANAADAGGISEAAGYKGGERVKHRKYGEGMVVGVKQNGGERMITIIFDGAGTKVFDADKVKLTLIG